MTAVAGIVHDGQVWLGADSASVNGTSIKTRADSKVFTLGPLLTGHTTSWRFGQLVRYGMKLDGPPPGADLHEWMCTAFIPALRSCLADGGWAGKDKEGRESCGQLLAGIRGRLFEVSTEFGVAEPAAPYAAIGCGADLALGSLYSTSQAAMTPGERLVLALSAAERFSSGVRGPFRIEST